MRFGQWAISWWRMAVRPHEWDFFVYEMGAGGNSRIYFEIMITHRMQQRLTQAIKQKVFPGCVLGIVRASGECAVHATGNFTYDSDFPAMSPGAIFDVASLTKVIPTSCAALTLIDKGELDLSDKVVRFIPELTFEYADQITVKHLLTQTLDFGYQLSAIKELAGGELLNRILTTGLRSRPGTTCSYSNATSVLLGILVEKVSGKPLDTLASELFFDRLEMANSTFEPQIFRARQIVPTEIDPWRERVIVGETHDESAWQLGHVMTPGSAGLFSTVPDLLTFSAMILGRGVYKNRRYFSDAIIAQMCTNQIPELKQSCGLGWELNQPRFMGKYCAQLIGKTGFTGCSITLDMSRGIGVVLLSNYTYPQRKDSAVLINEVRCDVADLVFAPDNP